MGRRAFSGLLVPAITPFNEDLSVDRAAFVAFCRSLLDRGADGLAVFGTTSEANSLSMTERMELLEALVQGGIDPSRLMPGTGMCALPDAARLARHAVDLGCGGVLALPPFYYKPVGVEGLYAFYARLIETVGLDDLGLWLYHIPQMAGVGIPHDLIARLLADFPGVVPGIKDSSGDFANTEAILRRFPGFSVFPSSEGVLLKAMDLGAVGCISATGNVNPAGIRALLDRRGTPGAAELQRGVAAVRDAFTGYPLIPAVKAVCAAQAGQPGLARLRPPLEPLEADQAAALCATLDGLGLGVEGTLQ